MFDKKKQQAQEEKDKKEKKELENRYGISYDKIQTLKNANVLRVVCELIPVTGGDIDKYRDIPRYVEINLYEYFSGNELNKIKDTLLECLEQQERIRKIQQEERERRQAKELIEKYPDLCDEVNNCKEK